MSGFSGASNGLQKSATTMLSKNDKIESLYEQINWDAVVRDQILRLRDHQVLSRSHDNLEVVLDDKADAQELGRILMKLSDTPNDVNLVKYALHRSEHILGLLPKSNDQDDTSGSDTASNMGEGSLGIQHAHIFTFGGVYINDHGIVKALLCPDNDVQKSAGLVFAALLNVYEGDSKRLLQWIVSKLISTMDDAWELALPALSMCARTTSAGRKYALIEMGVVQHIVAVLTGLDVKGRTQQVYELCFVLWVLSLGELQTEPFLSAGVVHTLVELLSTAPTRKIVRMALATLANLAVTEDDALLNEMFTAGLLKVLDSMKHNNFNRDAADEDVENDLKSLYHVLTRNYRELSSYERWVTQVYSGTLRWSIVHTEKFWRENARFVEEDNFKALKKLLELLKSDDAQVVSVALYDVGEFSRFYPNGRVIVSRLGGKDQVMQIMESGLGLLNPEIQRNSLQCISKLMVTNWEFLR
mmetsp:Transcript_2948/g.4543  ORF Transcript_2948/g.4543 Transcript_2948/m.4543 type:complete len:471 (+) Transcript_2948:105-1517(+)